ncbi:MAG: alanine racemase [Anaerolineae bacterium]|nr:alanine racemase [Anaerolineae bacterium]
MFPAITRPAAILNTAVARRNIARMAEKARRSGVLLRPHFKTHQSAAIGEWFRAEGVSAITVSSVRMAQYFAAHGWRDIVVAFPVNWLEIEAINTLAETVDLGLLLESTATAQFLAERLTAPVQAWIEVDTGYHRTGIDWADAAALREVAAAVQAGPQMTLAGLLTHAGHSYHARSPEEIEAIYAETVSRLTTAREGLAQAGIHDLALSLGDTPCCSVVEDFSAVEEIRPGNFVFYDLMQVAVGACTPAEIAVGVACPVVAIYPEDHKVVVYGGAVHLSKEALALPDGGVSFGAVALPEDGGWSAPLPGCRVAGLSQEHGVIAASDDLLARVRVGDVLVVLPVHSCLTVDLLKHYVTLEGERIAMLGDAG